MTFTAFPGRDRGNALLLCLLVIAMLWAVATAQVSMLQRHVRQAAYFASRSELREYAESALALAKHDLGHHVTASEGFLGTAGWSATTDDVGADGAAGTLDEGEGDGFPTIGEPNTTPQPIGPAASEMACIAWKEDTANPMVKRLVAEARDGRARVVLDAYVRRALIDVPRTPPILIVPGAVLDLNGNAFSISGADRDLAGGPGGEPDRFGVATFAGATPGANATAFASQVDLMHYDQVLGAGGNPAMGEVSPLETAEIVAYFEATHRNPVPPGNYSTGDQGVFGSSAANDYRVTYVSGDLGMAGQLEGAGVLVVDGNFMMSGQSRWNGLVICIGHLTLTGGGAGVHIYGSVWGLGSTVTVQGNADVVYSSEALDAVDDLIENSWVYYAMVSLREA